MGIKERESVNKTLVIIIIVCLMKLKINYDFVLFKEIFLLKQPSSLQQNYDCPKANLNQKEANLESKL